MQPQGTERARLAPGPVGPTGSLEGVPGRLVLLNEEQGHELGLRILDAPRLSLTQGNREPPGTDLVVPPETQP